MNQDNLNFKSYIYLILILNFIALGILIRGAYLLTNNYNKKTNLLEVKNYVETYNNQNSIYSEKEQKFQKILSSFSEIGSINSFTLFLNDASLQSGVKVIQTKILESSEDQFISEIEIVGRIDQLNSFIKKLEEDTILRDITDLKINIDKEKITAKLVIKNYRIKND